LKPGECIPLFLFVNAFLGFTQIGLEPLAAFQKVFVKNSGNVPTNRKKGIKFKRKWCIHSLFSKEF
jgi:hypothetical protein